MIILLLIGLALVVVSVALALRAVNMSRARSAEMVETIDAYGFSGRTESVLVRSGDSTRRTVRRSRVPNRRLLHGSNDNARQRAHAQGAHRCRACTRRHRASSRATG